MMKAVVVKEASEPEGKATVTVEDIPKPTLQPGEALIQILRVGVCNTDLELCDGYMGFKGVLGHEFVGVVREVKGSDVEAIPVTSVTHGYQKINHEWLIGKRICGEINLACRSCSTCLRKDDRARNHCGNRTVLGILGKQGCFAEYLTLPLVNLHVVPDCVSDDVAVFVEPLAAACRILEQGVVVKGSTQRVAILGDGKLGLMCCEVLGRAGLRRRPTLFGRHTERLALVKDLVETRLVPGEGENVVVLDVAVDVTADVGVGEQGEEEVKFDVVVDCTGSPAGLDEARKLLTPMGTLVLKSTCAAAGGFNAAPFVIDELRLIGSRCGPFPEALALLTAADEKDRVDPTKYISSVFNGLEQIHQAFQKAKLKDVVKVQVIVSPM